MLQPFSRQAQLHATRGSSRKAFDTTTLIIWQHTCMARPPCLRISSCSSSCWPALPSTACRARLPHMDEEIEHMQWQLDKRTLDGSSGTGGSSKQHKTSRGRAATKHQHVFHDRAHSNRQHHHHHHSSSGSSSSAASSAASRRASVNAATAASTQSVSTLGTDSSCFDSMADLDVPGSPASSSSISSLGQQQQQQQHYYHMQLQLQSPASIDLPKSRDRLSRHIQQDGGCYVSASTARSSILTHLLLNLQHKQVQERPGSVLMLQPVDCDELAAAAAATANADSSVSSSSSTVVQLSSSGHELHNQNHHHHGHHGVASSGSNAAFSCSTDQLKFWVTAMPLDILLGLMADLQEQTEAAAGSSDFAAAAAAAAARAAAAGSYCSSVSSTVLGTVAGSMLDGSATFSTESSTEEWQAYSSSSSSSAGGSAASLLSADAATGSSSGSSSKAHAREAAAVLEAAGSSCSSTGAVLLQAVTRGCLKSLKIGAHAQAAPVAASISAAVSAGLLVSLHIKGHAAAHAVAYTALGLAASRVLSGFGRSACGPAGFGFLLVPGHEREHVHAVAHTHGHAGGEFVHKGDHSKVPSDASMAVGGFGAAFYGIGDSSSNSSGKTGEHGAGLQHKHAQEMWLCVVPLSLAD